MKILLENQSFWLKTRGRTILSHTDEHPMIYVGTGRENVDMYRGNFKIEDYVTERRPLKLTGMCKDGHRCTLDFEGILKADLTLEEDCFTMDFTVMDERINRFWLRAAADPEEKCYGCGEQMSYFNLRGRHFPLWTSEPGVGRDKSTYITWRSDVDSKAGGDYYNTNFPQPTYISTKHYYLHMDSSAYADFDFRNETFHELQVWEVPARIRIEAADTYMELLEKLTAFLGRQPELPDWIYNGLIIGVQGGNERSFGLLEKTLKKGIKVAGVWCQDWAGKRETSFGKRLQWNWRYDADMYPGLEETIKKLHERNIRFLGYLNPYLVQDGDLYEEGRKNGYFAVHGDGSDYLVDFGEFYCGVVDLTNPKAYNWFKDEVIKKYTLSLGIDGWMADFGEYLPTDDIVLHSGESPMTAHNKWPALWAKCNYDAVKESGRLGETVFFMRAGGTGSQRYCTLLWAGDQSVDFTIHDGLASVICGALSAGMTGCGLTHSDIGGYTSLYDNIRTKELFLRWAEMAAFTAVMRTHEGNRPDTNFQYYDDEDTMERLARLVDIYTMLTPYTRELVHENAVRGIPVQRPLFLRFESDPRAYDIQYEYMLGDELVVAPVYQSEKDTWSLYLPKGDWVHLWTGTKCQGGDITVPAGLGYPPVFYEEQGAHRDIFEAVRSKYGL